MFSGGGSGGHIVPSLAIAKQLGFLLPEAEILFVVSRGPLDAHIVTHAGFEYTTIYSGKLRRSFSPSDIFYNLCDIFSLCVGFFQSFWLLVSYRPDVVFSKGGFVAVPVAIAAWILRIPVVAHESDTYMGLANKIIQFFAQKMTYTFPEKSTPKHWLHVGTPLRQELFKASAESGKKLLNITDEQKIILFIGASQGSVQINLLAQSLFAFFKNEYHFVIISGGRNNIPFPKDKGFHLFDFLEAQDLYNVMEASDIIISRAGANSLFEIAAMKKAAIIIPHPQTGGDHQRKNAKVFEKSGAICVFDPSTPQEELQFKVKNHILFLKNNPEKQAEYENRISSLGKKDAAVIVAELLASYSAV